MKLLKWIKRILLTLLSIIAGSFVIAFFICILHSLFAFIFSFIKYPNEDEILYVAAVVFVLLLIFNVYALITGKFKEEDSKVKEEYKDVKKEEIVWRHVMTRPTFEVGDCYSLYNKPTDSWFTIKVVDNETSPDIVGVLCNDDKEPRFAVKSWIIDFWEKTQQHIEKNRQVN